jgi:hypothetical protein
VSSIRNHGVATLSTLFPPDSELRRMRAFIASCIPDGEGVVDVWGPKRVTAAWAGETDGEEDYDVGVFDLDLPDRADRIDITEVYAELSRRSWVDPFGCSARQDHEQRTLVNPDIRRRPSESDGGRPPHHDRQHRLVAPGREPGGGRNQRESVAQSDYITLAEAVKTLPGRQGRRISLKTVHRWSRKGLRHGVRLRTAMIGGRRCTTQGWLRDFIETLSKLSAPVVVQPAPPRTQRQRQIASDRATSELMVLWAKGTDRRPTEPPSDAGPD